MSETVNWSNPYANREGTWLKGNLHTHTSPASACGRVSMDRTLSLYENAGYDFLSISDHMTLSHPQSGSMALVSGIEWNRPDGGGHTGVYSCNPDLITPACAINDQVELLSTLSGKNTLLILNHPNWQLRPHYRREELQALSGYDGIEVFNGVIKRLDGYEISTDKWDYLLSSRRRVLGFASDDFHLETDLSAGWNMVRAESTAPEAIFDALKCGNFYATSGVHLADIYREGKHITVESANGEEIQAIGSGGILLETVKNRCMTVDISKWDTCYVRFAIYGSGSSMAWTQPFFNESV